MSWVTKPLPLETCGCGAEWFPSSRSIAAVEAERASFREAHAHCRAHEVIGRCGTCNHPTDRLPCPYCVLREITEVDDEGQPVLSLVEMYQRAADALQEDD